MIKAIITDLDRTLLRTDKSVSPRTLQVLKSCREKGILVMAASARPMRFIQTYDELVHFDAATTMNGAILCTPGGVKEYGIPRETAEAVLEKLCAFPNIFLSVETNIGLYSNKEIPAWEPIIYHSFPKLPKNAVTYKILASSQDTKLYENIETLLCKGVYSSIANSGVVGQLIQIMSDKATKWNGVQEMLACFGVDPKDTVYFGDDNDDIEPILNCGIGVAVANGIPRVLEAADIITSSNDEDGVSEVLESLIQ